MVNFLSFFIFFYVIMADQAYLPFHSVRDDELITLLTSDYSRSYFSDSFDPCAIIDGKYNNDLDINQSCLRSKYLNVPQSEYIFLDSFPLVKSNCNTKSVLSMNIRSIPANITSFVDLILDNTGATFDVIGLTETRLDSDLIPLYQLPEYNMFNQCRNRYGGGVTLYVSNSYSSTMMNEFSFVEPYLECVSVQCDVNNNTGKKILYMCIYRPPNGNINCFINKMNEILSLVNDIKYYDIYILGDFNLDLMKNNEKNVFEFINLMYSFSLFPLITKPTRVTNDSATLIDHIWITRTEDNIANYIIHSDITDHFPVLSQFNSIKREPAKPVFIKKRLITQTAVEHFITDLSEVNWEDVLTSNCASESYNLFFTRFISFYHKHFPEKNICLKKKDERSPYVTPALKKSIKEKNRLERLASKWPITFKEIYRQYRNKLTSLLRAAKNKYYKDQLQTNQGNAKMHWKSINSILGRNSKVDNNIIELIPVSTDIPNEFNSHFLKTTETFNVDQNNNYLKYLVKNPAFSMYLSPVTQVEINTYLQGLKTNTPGYDEISPLILKQTSSIILAPLTHIINLTLKTGVFPLNLKIAKVIPIHKSGSKTNINNYRPISILPAFSKIFEKAIATRLISYLEKNKLLTDCQHGFRENHSTETAILQFTEGIYKHLENKHYVAGVFIDLSKAFDSLNHHILLHKLEHIGIRGVPLNLFKSYISDRSQSVFCNAASSSSKTLSTGVPQGSILGPLLFLIYIDDIVKASTKFKYTIYADDTNLLIADKNLFNLHSNLTTELGNISKWIKDNKLRLNISKTTYILFKNRSINYHMPAVFLEDEQLQCVSHTKFLGVHIDENLNWNHHINEIQLKLSRISGILYKVRNSLTIEAMLSIYYTLCYPNLIYCISIWGCTWPSFLNKLKVALNKIIRCMFFLGKYDSTSVVYSSHSLLNLNSIHKCFLLIFIFKSLKNCNESSAFRFIESNHRTRANKTNLICPQFRTTLFKNSIFCVGPLLWNSLPDSLKILTNVNSVFQYKRNLKKHLFSLQNE